MAATDSQANEGPPLTELESLQLKANQVTDESLESTRRMIALCEDVSKFSRLLWIKLYKYLNLNLFNSKYCAPISLFCD